MISGQLQQALPCTIIWEWVKGHQTRGVGNKWNLEVALNNFCDKKAEGARLLIHEGDTDPFFPDQKIGITRQGGQFHGSPRDAIMEATHDLELKQYICTKSSWTSEIFDSLDWEGFRSYMQSITSVRQTNVIKMTHEWIHDGHQKDVDASMSSRMCAH